MIDPDLHYRLATLNAEYARAIDDDRLEAWPEFFLERCMYKVTTADNHRKGLEAGIIYAESKAMLQDRVSALRKANIYERQRYRHLLGLPAVLVQEPGAVHSEPPFLIARIVRDGATDLFATGRYVDRVAVNAGELKFAERIVVCDSARFDTLVALPL